MLDISIIIVLNVFLPLEKKPLMPVSLYKGSRQVMEVFINKLIGTKKVSPLLNFIKSGSFFTNMDRKGFIQLTGDRSFSWFLC
jgi:hypothetical protein